MKDYLLYVWVTVTVIIVTIIGASYRIFTVWDSALFFKTQACSVQETFPDVMDWVLYPFTPHVSSHPDFLISQHLLHMKGLLLTPSYVGNKRLGVRNPLESSTVPGS